MIADPNLYTKVAVAGSTVRIVDIRPDNAGLGWIPSMDKFTGKQSTVIKVCLNPRWLKLQCGYNWRREWVTVLHVS